MLHKRIISYLGDGWSGLGFGEDLGPECCGTPRLPEEGSMALLLGLLRTNSNDDRTDMARKPITEAPFQPANSAYYGQQHDKFLSYPGYRDSFMRPVQDFVSEMKVVDWERGRSAMTIWMEDPKGTRYPMFMKDYFALTTQREQSALATYECEWSFVKRGANYGIRWVDAVE